MAADVEKGAEDEGDFFHTGFNMLPRSALRRLGRPLSYPTITSA